MYQYLFFLLLIISPLATYGMDSANTPQSANSTLSADEPLHLNKELREAAQKGNARKLAQLIQLGAEVNSQVEDIWTPLDAAAIGGHAECLDLLIRAGANVNEGIFGDPSPLMHAAANGYYECVNKLIEAGAHVNYQNSSKDTPLTWACFGGEPFKTKEPTKPISRYKCIRLLVLAGANVNQQRKETYETPLMLAARSCDFAVCNLLLRAGAQPVFDSFNPPLYCALASPEDLAKRIPTCDLLFKAQLALPDTEQKKRVRIALGLLARKNAENRRINPHDLAQLMRSPFQEMVLIENMKNKGKIKDLLDGTVGRNPICCYSAVAANNLALLALKEKYCPE